MKKKHISLILLYFSTLICCSFTCNAATTESYNGISLKAGDILDDNSIVISNQEQNIAKGITENYCLFNTPSFDEQNSGYFLTVDLMNKDNNIQIVAGYHNYDASNYAMSTITDQANSYESIHPNQTVIAGINADFFLMQTGEPRGALVMNKTIYHPINKRNFFAITRDGTPAICNSNGKVLSSIKKGKTLTLKENVRHAVGGGILLVRDGEIAPAVYDNNDKSKATRSAIGIKADGTVIVYIAHGTKKPVANGETYKSIANKMIKAGCQTALALDGGGSATYVSKTASGNKLEIRNHPSDGAQRQVASSLLFVTSTASFNEYTPEESSSNHTYIYDSSNNEVVCTAHDETHKMFTGFVKDKDKNEYFLLHGIPLKGWKIIGEQPYYFNKYGISKTVTIQSETPPTCTSTGNTTYFCSAASSTDGRTFSLKKLNKIPGHDYSSDYICKNCNWRAISLKDCTISIPYGKYYYTGKERTPSVTISYQGKKLNPYFDYKITYENNTDVGTGTIIIDPNVKTYIDLTETRGSLFGGSVYKKLFSIIPNSPTNLKSTPTGCNSLRLNWKKSVNADGYKITKYNSQKKSYQFYKNTTSSYCNITKLSSGYTYGFRVIPYKLDASGKKVYGNNKYVQGITIPRQVTNLRLASSKNNLTVKWQKTSCSGYQIIYSRNKNFSKSTKLTVKTSSQTTKQIRKLTKNKRYYIKVRAYKESSKCKRVYGKWSSVNSIVL